MLKKENCESGEENYDSGTEEVYTSHKRRKLDLDGKESLDIMKIPNEVTFEIASYLDLKSKKNFRLVCKNIRKLVDQRKLLKMKVDFSVGAIIVLKIIEQVLEEAKYSGGLIIDKVVCHPENFMDLPPTVKAVELIRSSSSRIPMALDFRIESLHLYGIDENAPIFQSLSLFTNLTFLDWEFDLAPRGTDIVPPTSLKKLSFTGKYLFDFSNWNSLEELDWKTREFVKGFGHQNITSLENLEKLSILFYDFSFPLPPKLTSLTLQSMKIRSNREDYQLPENLNELDIRILRKYSPLCTFPPRLEKLKIKSENLIDLNCNLLPLTLKYLDTNVDLINLNSLQNIETLVIGTKLFK